jgi:lactoylglutathione lyase
VYLLRDGVVLELLRYRPDRAEPWRKRSMAEPGLTHISLTVEDLDAAVELVEQYGGKALRETQVGPTMMVRDPDGQLLELLPPAWRESLPPLPPTTA